MRAGILGNAVVVALCVAALPLAVRGQVEKTAEGVIVPAGEGLVSVTVRTDDVLHVQYAKDKAFFGHASITALPRTGAAPKFDVVSDASTATVSTAKVKAVIDLKTGVVSFLDAAGKPILAEKARTLEAANVQGENTFHVRQQWVSDPAESLYGMGQMQLGFINIKDWDLDFWQHNGTIVVPFMVSNKGYGIYWDNTSYTRMGDLGAFGPIPATCLVDSTGTAGGLSTGGFATSDGPMQNPTTTPTIGGGGGRGGAGRGRGAGGPVGTRWEGKLAPTVTGDYQFQAYSSGTIKTWIDGKLVMDHYRQNWLPWYDVARIHMEAGKQYAIKLEWIPDGNNFQFNWKLPVADRAAQGTALWSEVGGGVDYYFCYGPSMDRLISGFRNITGKATMMPNWALGYWQSKDHFSTQQQSIDAVKMFRDKQIPLDNIVQDWQYWPGQSLDTIGSWAFNNNYPDPEGWIKAIHAQHAHLMISVWGWISERSSPNTNYQQMLEKKYLLGMSGGRGGRTFTDFFNPDAGKLFWQQVNSELFVKGIDAWWLDGSEPDIAGSPTLDSMRTLMNPNGMGTGAKVLNAYPVLESKYVYEGQRAAAPDQRVFILTRSGFPGMQRYSASVWSGDTTSTWPAMRKQIMAGLGYSISGMPWWTMDIGGYQTPPAFSAIAQGRRTAGDPLAEEWDELNTRWFQFGTFCPLMRVHGQGNRELYNFGPAAQDAMIKSDKLRYALMPYIYSLTGSVVQNDDTIMRPLVMDFTADAKACAVDDQYMYGPAILVTPVTTYKARTKSVYLPQTAGGWFDFWSGKAAAAGTTVEAAAPYDAMPLFIKGGSIVPTSPVMQYVGEKPADNLTLYVYAGANGAFTLYEDEGVNYNYEKGAFAQIPITWDEAGKTLTIGARQGTFPGMLAARTFNVIFVSKDKAAGFAFDAKADKTVRYTGAAVQVKP
jgi:alpha-D-xyloside xylohydrolase